MNHNSLFTKILIQAVVFIYCASTMMPVFAATPPPDAGKISGSQNEVRLNPGVTSKPDIKLGQQQKESPETTKGPKFKVNGVKITGQNLYSEKELTNLIKDSFGKELTLGELEQLAGKITTYFRDNGYIVAKAYIPPQDIRSGIVEIAVVIGKYGKITVQNKSQLSKNIADAIVSDIKSGDYIQNGVLEKTVFHVNDTSGVEAKATLAPGKTYGTSDLTITINDTDKCSGQIYADNWGNRFTGKNRLGLNLNINNLTDLGDIASIDGVYTGSGMNDYNLSYALPLGHTGAKLGAGYSKMHYNLGADYADIDATGMSQSTNIFTSFEFIRSRNFNLNFKIAFDGKKLQDRIGYMDSITDKKTKLWTYTISGDSRDTFCGGGMNNFGLSYADGRLDIESAGALLNDSQSAKTNGDYSKTNFSFSRVQYLNPRLNLFLTFSGQVANKNLDSSEQFQLGGPTGVRAYPVGEASCDQGYVFNSELRWNMPNQAFQLAAFYDNGKAIINKSPWDDSVNKKILAGAGLGLIWSKPGNYSFRLDYAWKITTDNPATSDSDKNSRYWLQCIKYF